MNNQFYQLSVSNIIIETKDTVSISFQIPAELKTIFQFTSGQYITIKKEMNGKEERRAYSMSSSPFDQDFTVSVKKVKGGKLSTYFHDKLKVGETLEVMPPTGRFFTPLDAANRKSYYLFAAGSGITPIISIIKSILEIEPKSEVFLLYGNRNEENIIFKSKLDEIEKKYEGQLEVQYILSQPTETKKGGLFGAFKKSVSNWEGMKGRINDKNASIFLDRYPSSTAQSEYFICGPGNMIEAVIYELTGRGVDKKHIHQEHFFTDDNKKVQTESHNGPSKMKVTINGETFETEIAANKTILDVLIAMKKNPPFSCQNGACSTCMAKLIDGEVEMANCYALEEDEIADGYILTCQAKPKTPYLEVKY